MPKRLDVAGYYSLHFPATIPLLAAAAALYGWAAMATIALVVISALAAVLVWRRVGRRGRLLNPYRCAYMALVLSLALPPHLLGLNHPATWPIVPAAGILLIALTWLLGPLGSGRVQPVLATYLIIVSFFLPLLTPHRVLRPGRVVTGNLFDSEYVDPARPRTVAWYRLGRGSNSSEPDAFYISEPAAHELVSYTSGRQQPDRFSVSLGMILRDRLPPLEDFIVGGQPGPIGASSAMAVILGGLLLMHRGLIDYRIPLLACLAAAAAMLLLPVPVIIKDTGIEWSWLAFRQHDLGQALDASLVIYELLASPLLFVLFFLAPSGQSQPMSRRGKAVYGILIGLLVAPAQLYGSVALGPYVALLLAGLTSVILDRFLSPRALV
ncbi:MAG TPA: RnfABCDGE type electron transport complex subunit D [Tepidisphaeraceae bacterium]|nr:RnfABCDGE type electron transport complex subunit D [Tepidisphaeraceae bacterium]